MSFVEGFINIKFEQYCRFYNYMMCCNSMGKSVDMRWFKSVSTRVPGSRATCHLTDFIETLPV